MRLLLLLSLVGCFGSSPPVDHQPPLNIVIDGNSLSIGVNGVPAYAAYLPFAVINVAIGGQTTADMIARFDDVQAAYKHGARNILIAWEGTNDLYFGATPENATARLINYRDAARRKGWEVLLLTLLPRASTPDPQSFERQRLAVNAALRASKVPLLDVAADTEMGPFEAVVSSPYYQADRVHLAEPGARRIAAAVTHAVRAIESKR